MRYVIDYPDWEFFSTLQAWTERVRENTRNFNAGGVLPAYGKALNGGSPLADQFMLVRSGDGSNRQLFHMTCIGVCDGGAVMDVFDPTGLLDGMRKDAKAHVELRPGGGDLEGSRVAGPYPVIRGDVLFDALNERVCNAYNLRVLGAGIGAHGDEGVALSLPDGERTFTAAQIEEEFSSRNSPALGDWSLDDARKVALDLNRDWGDGNVRPGKAAMLREDPLAFFGRCLEDRVGRVREALADRCARNAFLGGLRDLIGMEQEVIRRSDGLKGLRRSERYGGTVLGEARGMTLVVKDRLPGHEELGNGRYLAFSDGHRAVSYQNAVRYGHVDEPSKVIAEVMAGAERRDRNIRRFDRFRDAVSGRRHGEGVSIK
jgi:hypothetical protein